jgi:hypothetical protein
LKPNEKEIRELAAGSLKDLNVLAAAAYKDTPEEQSANISYLQYLCMDPPPEYKPIEEGMLVCWMWLSIGEKYFALQGFHRTNETETALTTIKKLYPITPSPDMKAKWQYCYFEKDYENQQEEIGQCLASEFHPPSTTPTPRVNSTMMESCKENNITNESDCEDSWYSTIQSRMGRMSTGDNDGIKADNVPHQAFLDLHEEEKDEEKSDKNKTMKNTTQVKLDIDEEQTKTTIKQVMLDLQD